MRSIAEAMVVAIVMSQSFLTTPAWGGEGARGIEEIVVTARKKEEALQSVPVAVTAVTEEEIEQSFLRNIEDLEGMSPNLVIDGVGAGAQGAALSIRGIQFSDIEKSFDPAVGVLIDGVYIGTNASQLFNVFDMERIEVLRGPQGTLFGRNTIGGTINVIRTQPIVSGEARFRAQVIGGSHDRLDLNGVANFPIIQDRLGAKIAIQSRQGGGDWLKNIAESKKSDGVDYFTTTATIRWLPTDALDLTYTYQYEREQTDSTWVQNMSRPSTSTVSGDLGDLQCFAFGRCQIDARTSETGSLNEVTKNFPNDIDLKGNYHTLKGTWDASESQELTLLLAYRKAPELVYQDFDAVDADLFSTVRDHKYDQTSVDLQLNSLWSDNLTSTAGVFFWNSEYTLIQDTFFLFGLIPEGTNTLQDTTHETDSWAVYAEVDWTFAEAWTLTLGGRYTEDKKKVDTTFGALEAGDLLLAPGTNVVDKDKWNEFTPKVGLRYQINSDHMVYGSWARGFRSGGYNGRAASVGSVGPYDPETVDNYEIGWRSTWMDGALVFNATGFFTEYKDKQEEFVRPAPPPVNQETVVDNVSKAEITGIELELLAQPTEYLTLRANYGALDAEYKEYAATDPNLEEIDLSFLNLRRAPENTFSAGAVITAPMGEMNWTFSLDGRWKDDYDTNARNIPEGLVKSHWIVDASVALEINAFTVRGFVRNLNNERWISSTLDVGGGIFQDGSYAGGLWSFGGATAPRAYGLELTFDTAAWN